MTKIYEALDQASQDQGASSRGPVPAVAGLPRGLEDKLLSLCRLIASLSERTSGAIATGFVGAQEGRESAHILAAFAKIAAVRMSLKTLVCATGAASPVDKLLPGYGLDTWESLIDGQAQLSTLVHESSTPNLHVTKLASSLEGLPNVVASSAFADTMHTLRGQYELILFDAPPFGGSSDALIISPHTDGMVIVVEAGKTRWQAVQYLATQLVAHGGTVLGVVLNNRRFYIPNAIYQRL